MDEISKNKKNILQKSVGSLKKIIPATTDPTAPIPAQTAYEVPIGNVLLARNNMYILMETLNRNATIQSQNSEPVEPLAFARELVKPTSKSPPMMRYNQAIQVES